MKNNNKTVVITGGTKGIGAGISKIYIENNYNVAIISRNKNALDYDLGENVKHFQFDLTNISKINILVKEIYEWTGRIDILINNVGLSVWMPIEKITEAFVDNMFNTNIKSMLFLTKYISPYLENGSSIVNISSIAGKRGTANNSIYCATKFAMNGITQSLAKELGIRGVRVNSICPVLINTEGLIDAFKKEYSPAYSLGANDFMMNFALKESALKRLPSIKEVADFCYFLSSDSSSAITGQNINIDCGVFPQ